MNDSEIGPLREYLGLKQMQGKQNFKPYVTQYSGSMVKIINYSTVLCKAKLRVKKMSSNVRIMKEKTENQLQNLKPRK